jgi:hypothetical protein
MAAINGRGAMAGMLSPFEIVAISPEGNAAEIPITEIVIEARIGSHGFGGLGGITLKIDPPEKRKDMISPDSWIELSTKKTYKSWGVPIKIRTLTISEGRSVMVFCICHRYFTLYL